MQKVAVSTLPKRYRLVDPDVSTDVDIFNFLAFVVGKVIDDVEVFEASPNVISEIDAVGRVAACCSPVSGVTL